MSSEGRDKPDSRPGEPGSQTDPDHQPKNPTIRAKLRPFEYLGGAAVCAVFTALVVLMATRNWLTTAIAFGVVFIVVLVAVAMLLLAVKPDEDERREIEGYGDQSEPDSTVGSG